MKKVLCFMLVLAMGMAFCVPVTNASTATPTVEDILLEYYADVLQLQNNPENSTATYSRQGGGNALTLQQETVNALTEAGYEAYNITPENYSALEESLDMDFAEYDIDPNGSYLIIFCGEEDSDVNQNSRSLSLPEQDIIDDGSGEIFTYYYDVYDRTYTMRYLIVVGEAQSETVNLVTKFGSSYVNTLANTAVTGCIGSASIYTTDKTLGTLRSLWGLSSAATYSTPSLSATCSVVWTRRYIQIKENEAWLRTSFSEYASTSVTFTGRYYSSILYGYDTVSYTGSATIYSPNYNNSSQLKLNAVLSMYGALINDETGNIQVKAKNQSGNETILVEVSESS